MLKCEKQKDNSTDRCTMRNNVKVGSQVSGVWPVLHPDMETARSELLVEWIARKGSGRLPGSSLQSLDAGITPIRLIKGMYVLLHITMRDHLLGYAQEIEGSR